MTEEQKKKVTPADFVGVAPDLIVEGGSDTVMLVVTCFDEIKDKSKVQVLETLRDKFEEAIPKIQDRMEQIICRAAQQEALALNATPLTEEFETEST
jgi:hypothetical protein